MDVDTINVDSNYIPNCYWGRIYHVTSVLDKYVTGFSFPESVFDDEYRLLPFKYRKDNFLRKFHQKHESITI